MPYQIYSVFVHLLSLDIFFCQVIPDSVTTLSDFIHRMEAALQNSGKFFNAPSDSYASKICSGVVF
jgi:hypothetical protein